MIECHNIHDFFAISLSSAGSSHLPSREPWNRRRLPKKPKAGLSRAGAQQKAWMQWIKPGKNVDFREFHQQFYDDA